MDTLQCNGKQKRNIQTTYTEHFGCFVRLHNNEKLEGKIPRSKICFICLILEAFNFEIYFPHTN